MVILDIPFSETLGKAGEDASVAAVIPACAFVEETEEIHGGFKAGLRAAIKAIIEGLFKYRWITVRLELIVGVGGGGKLFRAREDLGGIFFLELMIIISISLQHRLVSNSPVVLSLIPTLYVYETRVYWSTVRIMHLPPQFGRTQMPIWRIGT